MIILFVGSTSRSQVLNPAVRLLVGQPGGTPGPVEMEDPRIRDEPLASW